MLLNGMWKFSFNGGAEVPLPVPGCFDAEPAFRFLRGLGRYRTTVTCGGRVELRLGGLGLRARIFWDGRLIGSETTAYTPLELRFDAGVPGEHELKIVCDNTIEETAESQFRRFYDFYGFGGIYRDVELRELPDANIAFVRVLPLDAAAGRIQLHIETEGAVRELRCSFDGGTVFTLNGAGDYTLMVPHPRLWSPGDPHLHRLKIVCGEDVREVCFGLRSITARAGALYLNGEKLRLVGVNRHDVWPASGPAVPPEVLRKDLEAIKNAGMNFIRGSHYPQSEAMLEIADELGLLVWEEILGWENPVDSLQNAEFIRRQSDAMRRMIRAGVNHPCIVFWGFLNEGVTNEPTARNAVAALAGLIHEEDPSRLRTFATMFGTRDLCLDLVDVIAFNTYPGWYGGDNRFFDAAMVQNALKELFDFARSREELAAKPVVISEIGAAALIGDHSGRRWSEEYQAQLILCALETAQDPRCSGILFWQYCDAPVDDNVRIMMRPRGYNNKGLVNEFRVPKLVWRALSDKLNANV